MRRTLSGSLWSGRLALIAALLALPLGLGAVACSSSKPQVEEPEQKTTTTGHTDSPPEEHDPGEANTQLAMPDGTAKPPEHDDRVPDDYTVTRGDCLSLGERLTVIIRREYTDQLNPKLSAEKREEGQANIEKVAQKLGGDFSSMCENGMVGKVVDRAALQCAMNAGTAKAFETCMGGGGPEPAAPPNKKK